MYLLFPFTYLSTEWQITSLILFSIINKISISFTNSNLTLVSFNAVNLVLNKFKQDQDYTFRNNFQDFQKWQLIAAYHFEHIGLVNKIFHIKDILYILSMSVIIFSNTLGI